MFIGGGLGEPVIDACLDALRPLGRLVCNAVTLESEMLLIDMHRKYGGELIRMQVNRAEPVGAYRGWRPHMPVTQWSLIKR